MKRQNTLAHSSAWIEGAHLDQDARARVRFHPASVDEGIVFVRADEPDAPEVPCLPEHVRSMPRWTSLEANGHWVHHTEHVLAAIAFCGVDNVRVEMNTDRVPMTGGGTCEDFVMALQAAGQSEQDAPRRVYSLKSSVCYLDTQNTRGENLETPTIKDGRYVLGLPAPRQAVTAIFHWSHMDSLPLGVAEYEDRGSGPDELFVCARSYLVESELDETSDMLGPVKDHVMMLYPGCPTALALEAARHKVVDFIGDMMVLGRPLVGRFVACRAGHRIHHALVQKMIQEQTLQLVDLS